MIFSKILDLIKPVLGVVDNLHTSEEERLALKAKLVELEGNILIQTFEYEKAVLIAQQEVLKTEAQGHSWIQRNWRPIAMLNFLVLINLDTFGLLPVKLPEQYWSLIQLGLGGYVIGRSAEKIVPTVINNLKAKEN